MKRWKKISVILLAMIMALAMAVPASAATVKINKTKATICTGQTLQLKMVGTKAKPKWFSNSRNAIVNSAGKVTAKARGTATITAKIGKKSYRCLVTVEAPRISSSNISLYKGKTAQLKMLNTKQKYRWSSSNTKVATVSSTGKISGKSAGTAYVFARSASGKTFKCKVTVKNHSNKPKGSITYKTAQTPLGEVIIMTNHYNYAVCVDVSCAFYLKGKMVSVRNEYNTCVIESGRKYVTYLLNMGCTWDSVKVSLKHQKATYMDFNIKNISCSSSWGQNGVVMTVKNKGKRNEGVRIAVVYYKNNKIVGCDDNVFANVQNKGDVDFVESRFPFDSNYNTIIPDRYEVYINKSYAYK